jgi:hypothetical protein
MESRVQGSKNDQGLGVLEKEGFSVFDEKLVIDPLTLNPWTPRLFLV